MTLHLCSRRESLAAAVAVAASAVLPLPVQAQARRGAGGNDWLAVVKQHHDLIRKAFKVLLAPDKGSWNKRDPQLRNLDQLLNAHSFAEEVVLYPALARAGMAAQADQFYLAEAHVKIENARLELLARGRQRGDGWKEPALALQKMVLAHAHEEETDEFPKLQQKLSPQDNQLLARLYATRFSSVIAPRI